jgi:hypothetical protein
MLGDITRDDAAFGVSIRSRGAAALSLRRGPEHLIILAEKNNRRGGTVVSLSRFRSHGGRDAHYSLKTFLLFHAERRTVHAFKQFCCTPSITTLSS